MVTLKQLQKQIARERVKIAEKRRQDELALEKVGLQKELKSLQRSTSSKRNIALAKRTGRGLKILGGKVGRAAIRQGKLIRDQQLRDEAKIEKREKEIAAMKKRASKRKVKIKSGSPGFLKALDF